MKEIFYNKEGIFDEEIFRNKVGLKQPGFNNRHEFDDQKTGDFETWASTNNFITKELRDNMKARFYKIKETHPGDEIARMLMCVA